MANKKITELTALTDPDANDLLAIVDDPSGSPVTKQITATKLVKSLNNQSATFVVAASDSLHKERADYVCDGVDDQVEIQAAIDTLPSNGGKIILAEGLFVGRFAIDKNNVILEGQGMYNTILKLPDGLDVPAQTLTIAADYVTVRNLQVDGNRDNQIIPGGETRYRSDGIAAYGDYITIEHCYVHDPLVHGIIFWTIATGVAANAERSGRDYVTNNKVLFNRVENCGNPTYAASHSIDSAFHTHSFRVEGNYVKGDGQYSAGIGYHGGRSDVIANNVIENTISGGININQGNDVVVIGNTVKNYVGNRGAICVYGDSVYGYSNRVTVIGNSIENSSSNGIYVYGAATDKLTDITIANNIIADTDGSGIYSNYGDIVNIHGNITTRTKQVGIAVTNGNQITIGCNIVEEPTGVGFLLDHADFANINGNIISNGNNLGIEIKYCNGVMVTTNVIKNSALLAGMGAMSIYGSATTHITDINIANNIIEQSTGSGIVLVYADFANINGNIISNMGKNGVRMGVVEYVLISDNTIRNFGNSSEKNGIYAYNFEAELIGNIDILNNKIDGGSTGEHGILIQSSPTNCTVKNNHITNVSVEAITLDAPANVILFEQYSNLFMDVLAASTNHVHAAITGTGAEQEITTAITNPDAPRNISITNSANSTGDVKIDGVDAKGNTVSDTITIVTGGIAYGVVAFATVSKITIPATVANPDTIAVGISDKLGLSNIIYASGDVYKVKVNNADDPTIGTANTTYDTVDCATINAGDDITIWYKSNLNIIS